MEFKGPIAGKIARFLYLYFELIDRIFRVTLRIRSDSSGISVSFHDPKTLSSPIDERIKKIDSARENLVESLKAIDELKSTTHENKKELEEVLKKLGHIEKEKRSVEQELEKIRKITNSDIEIFRKLAGVPDDSDRKKERVVGFISGIVASLIASAIIFGGATLWSAV